MKITKSYLKQIIKEELNHLQEVDPSSVQTNPPPQGQVKPEEPSQGLATKILGLAKLVPGTQLDNILRKPTSDLERASVLLQIVNTALSDQQIKTLLLKKYQEKSQSKTGNK